MIDYIKGYIDRISDNNIVVASDKIGYSVMCSSLCVGRLLNYGDAEVTVYTYLSVTDNGISLYGFSDREERDFFFKLTTVPKVGPKLALSVLSVYTPEELYLIVSADDVKAMSVPNGVGKKLAENMILNLKDKLTLPVIPNLSESNADKALGIKNEAVNALESLGFNRTLAYEAVNKIYSDDIDEESLIKLSLMALAK